MRYRRGHADARAAVFAPLDTSGRAEVVARRLADAVVLGVLADGEQLPSEAELADQLAVSTVTVREALTALRQQGLVETRRGRGGGSFVRAPADPSGAALRDRLRRLTLSDLRDLADHYAAVGGATARLAADRASPDDVERLQEAGRLLETASTVGAGRQAEGSFHLEVAAVAQSARLTRQELQLQSEVGPLLWSSMAESATRRHAATHHRDIVAAVAAGDGDRARDLTERHLADAFDRLIDLHLRLVEP